MKCICVYCGSSSGLLANYKDVANHFGKIIADREMTLVYGGASIGLMGALADSVLHHGGKVIGVIPQSLLEAEVAHDKLTDLHITSSMHQRKSKMAELVDGFVALPGGFGTLEELFEILTWGQLRLHTKPIGLLNIEGYFDSLLKFMDHAVEHQFVYSLYREMLSVSKCPESLLDLLCTRYSCDRQQL